MMTRVLKNLLRRLMYGTWGEEPSDRFKKFRYRRIWISSVVITAAVAITPLLVMAGFNYAQYQRALREESTHPIKRLTLSSKRALEYSIEERKNALLYIVGTNTVAELKNEAGLKIIKTNLQESFRYFVDLGLIDGAGNVVSYVGPVPLEKKLRSVNYSNQDWFNEVLAKGLYVSDVFRGHRGNPHFVIAVRTRDNAGNTFILRATLDMEILTGQVPSFENEDPTDAFIVNRRGILQTRSRGGRDALQKADVPTPEFSKDVELVEFKNAKNPYVMCYAFIENTPFIFVMTKRMPDLMRTWLSLRGKLIGFLIGSIAVIMALTMAVSSVLVSRIREADMKHDAALHQIEYSAKMASIGRLAAGVAHEINNPLAIINEKAGLMQDLVLATGDFPNREKSLRIIDSILNSVERGSTITHRLLGFARHLDVQLQTIDMAALMHEALAFLEKEAAFRNIEIQTFFADGLPTIESDRGQLQQVFLNIINNAFEAIKKDGRVGILVEQRSPDTVTVVVSDTGPGIDSDAIDHIFEPFFTTKREGTGLGLSITYGIVRKLRGDIQARSAPGQGTEFIVTLPLTRPD